MDQQEIMQMTSEVKALAADKTQVIVGGQGRHVFLVFWHSEGMAEILEQGCLHEREEA